MNKGRLISCILLLLMLAGCGRTPVPTDVTEPETAAVTLPETEPEETAPAVPEETISETVATEVEMKTGMVFHAGDVTFRVGGLVSELVDAGGELGMDPETLIPAGQITGNIRVKISDEIYVFFHGFNDSVEEKSLSRCRIYSVTVNVQEGIQFGMEEGATFTSGVSTVDQILEAYGPPDYRHSNSKTYEEIAYYAPFDSVYYSFKDGIVRQVMAVYWQPGQILTGEYAPDGWFGNDALLLMGNYMDVSDYLSRDGSLEQVVSPDLGDKVIIGDEEIQLGCEFFDLPEIFTAPYESAPFYLDVDHYMLTGKDNGEEFYLLNRTDDELTIFRDATMIGIVTHNAGYTNWGSDYNNFHTFHYQGLDNGSTIEDILAIFGLPQQIDPSSSVNGCFVWMHYADADGDELRIRVDPMTNEIAELRILKYYPEAKMYQ